MYLCGDKQLLYDEACLEICNNGSETMHISSKLKECYQCDYSPLIDISPGRTKAVVISTIYSIKFKADAQDDNFVCEEYLFRQHGLYNLSISDEACSNIYTVRPPDNAYQPLWAEFWILLGIWILWNIATCQLTTNSISNCVQGLISYFKPSELETDLGSPSSQSVPLVQSEFVPNASGFRSRVKSLDTFRGITITLMLFVNLGGGNYWIFEHSPWNGLTIADIVFPWFAWIMGVSIVMSTRSHLRIHTSRRKIFLRNLQRTLVLVALGLMLNSLSTNDLYKIRIPGVLQRLGISYFIVAALESVFMKPQNSFTNLGKFIIFQDIFCAWIQWLVILALVGAHYTLSKYLPVPDCPTGYLGPGGLAENSTHVNCTGGAAGYIDRLLLGNKHLYQHPTAHRVYLTPQPYDPEGLLGILTTTLMVFLGAQAGRILLCYSYTQGRVKRWLIWAVLTGALAGHLCGWSKESGMIPVNKNLWSLSFVLATASFAFIMMSVLLLIIDHAQCWSGTPFHQPGKNSILLYVGHELTKKLLPWSWKPISDRSNHTEFLIMHTWGTCLWIFIAIILNNYEIYISV